MPRPVRYESARVQMQVRLPPALRSRLQKEADRRYVSMAYLVEQALESSLAKWEKEKRPA